MAYTPQDFLFQLVNSLDPKQKKDFLGKLKQTSGARGKSNYQVLFEEMSLMSQYDELKIKLRLERYMTVEVLSVVKNKLTERLLDYLRETTEETTLARLHKWLDYIEILFNKQMYREVDLYCEKVKKEAWQGDFHTIVIEANRWKGFVIQFTVRENIMGVLQALRADTQRSLDMIALSLPAGDFYRKVMGKIQQHFNLRNRIYTSELLALKNDPMFELDASNENYSFLPACYIAMAKHFIYLAEGDMEKAFEQESMVWKRINTDFQFYYKNKKAETQGAILNYMEAVSKTNHTDLFQKHMAFTEKLLAKEEKGNIHLELVTKIYQLYMLAKTKKEKLTPKDIAPFEQLLKSGTADQFTEFKHLIESYLANAFFLMRDYEQAKEYVMAIQKDYTRTEVRGDNYEYSRISYIVYEAARIISRGLKNDDIPGLQMLIKPYYDHIRNKPEADDYRFEFALVNFFKSLKQNMDKAKTLKKIDELEKELDTIFSERTGYLQIIRANFDYPYLLNRWRAYLK